MFLVKPLFMDISYYRYYRGTVVFWKGLGVPKAATPSADEVSFLRISLLNLTVGTINRGALVETHGKCHHVVRVVVAGLVLAHKLDRGLARLANLAQDVLGVDTSLLANLAEVNIAADSALVANPDDREGHAAVADNTLVHGAVLILLGELDHRHVELLDLLLEEFGDGVLDQG